MIRWGRQIFLGLFVLLLIGCGGGTSKSDSGTNNTSALQPDFGIAALPSVTVTPNSQQTISISVTGANGFSNPVNFTLSGLQAGVSASPATFTLTPAASSSDAVKDAGSSTQTSQTVTITSNPQVTAALVAMTVTATSGSITHTAVTPTGQADFALAVPNPALSLTAGSSAPLSISADAFNGFTGQVSVSLSGLPQGVTASPSTVKVTPGAAQTVTLTAAQSMQPTTATITLQGASGSLSHNRELSLAVSEAPPPPDFSLSVTPATLTLQACGSSEPFTVSATAQNGFTGTIQVALSGLPNGVAAMPATLTLTAGTPQQILLNAASTAPGATKTLTVEAASGSIAHKWHSRRRSARLTAECWRSTATAAWQD
jgi:hypothetical protein